MKILHIGKYFPPYTGGMEHYLRDLMVALARRGVDNAALVHRSTLGLASHEETYSTGGQALPITRAAVWARFLFTPISPTFPWLLNAALKQRQPDILHLHMPNVSVFWALLLPRARALPWVVHWHSDVLASQYSLGLRLFYTLYRPFERAVLKRSTAIIATSPPYLDSSEVLRTFRHKAQVVPLGLDPDTLLPSVPPPDADSATATTLRVLAIGRLSYYKGFEYLLRAAAQVENISVHLVGTGDQESRLQGLARELNLGRKIVFHGQLSPAQLAAQFSACDCLCLPSVERTEAFGMVLLEAMLAGKATVISDVPGSGMGWVVDDGETGLKVPPAHAEKLAAALLNLQRDRDRMLLLGKQGRQKFDRQFHIDQSAAGIMELYSKVTDRE